MPDIEAKFKIPAVIYINNYMLIGVCFPKIDTAFELPHMTLMLYGPATEDQAFSIMQQTCKDPSKFEKNYLRVKNEKDYASKISTCKVYISMKNARMEMVDAHFITFDSRE